MKALKWIVALLLLLPWTAFGAGDVLIKGQGPREFRRAIKTDGSGRLIGGIHVIDACEATTDWTALSNDTTGLDTDLDHVLGAKSLEFDKVDGAANTIFGGIQKTISSVDLSFLVENGGAFGMSLNVSATTDIDYCFLRLGTDASNYNEWRVADAGLSAGWNSLRFNADAPSSAGATGNGWNAAVVTYLALGCAFGAETDTLADLRVDHVTARVGLQVAADVNASVSSSSGASQFRLQDGDTTSLLDVEADAAATPLGLNSIPVLAQMKWTDGSTWNSVYGTTVIDNILWGAIGVPFFGSLSYFSGPSGWDRATGNTMADGLALPNAPWSLSALMAYNGTNLQMVRLKPGTNDLLIDINAQSLTALKVSATAAANALNNTIKVELSDGTNAFLDSTASPGFFKLQDGDGTDLIQVEAVSDGIASSKLGAYVNSRGMVYNGATWDMKISTPTGEAAVQDTSTRPGEDAANDWRAGYKKQIAVTNPNKQTTASIPTAIQTAFTSRYILNEPSWMVWVDNTGANPLTDLDVDISPDGVTWLTLDLASPPAYVEVNGCSNTLAAAAICYVRCAVGCSFEFLRVRAAAADANLTDLDVWFDANKQ